MTRDLIKVSWPPFLFWFSFLEACMAEHKPKKVIKWWLTVSLYLKIAMVSRSNVLLEFRQIFRPDHKFHTSKKYFYYWVDTPRSRKVFI